MRRITVKDIVIKGFTHFKRMAGTDEKKCFKELQKTFISRIQAEYVDIGLTAIISGHSNKEVVKKHYIARIEAAKKMTNFKVFS